MAGGEPAGEKTEAPSAKRQQDAAKKGDVLQSRELATAMTMLAGALLLAMTGDWVMQTLSRMLASGLSFSAADVTDFDMGHRSLSLLSDLAPPFGLLGGGLLLAATLVPALLGSWGFRMTAVQPKFAKINPVNGLKRMFGMTGLMELGKSIAKIVLLGAIGLFLLWSNIDLMAGLGRQDVARSSAVLGSLFVTILAALAGGLAVIAAIDVPFQWLSRIKKLRMTKQEVREEHKESDGSPEVKAALRRRQIARQTGSARRAMTEATVVLVNPTHFAVALRYRPGSDAAPVVLAKGRGEVALVMRTMAQQGKLPVLEYPALTRAIYFTSKVGQGIDERLYGAVAVVIAFVLRLDAEVRRDRQQPVVEVPEGMVFDGEGRRMG